MAHNHPQNGHGSFQNNFIYIGQSTALKLCPEEISGLKEIRNHVLGLEYNPPVTVAAWPHGVDTPLIQNGYVVQKTANNIFRVPLHDYLRYGHFSAQRDDFDMNFQGWLDAADKIKPIDYDIVKIPSLNHHSIAGTSFGEKRLHLLSEDTPVKLYVHDTEFGNWPNNKVGYAISHFENLRQSLTRYYRTGNAEELFHTAKKLGLSAEDIGYLVVMPSHAIYSVWRTQKDGKVALAAALDVYEKTAREARFFGIDPEEMRNHMLDEEHAHIYRKSVDKGTKIGMFLEEIKTKRMIRDMYLELAEGAQGNHQLQAKYTKLAKITQHDLDTIGRYLKAYYSKSSELESRLAEDSGREYSRKQVSGYEANADRAANPKGKSKKSKSSGKGLESIVSGSSGKVISISSHPAYESHFDGEKYEGKSADRESDDSEAVEGESPEGKSKGEGAEAKGDAKAA